MAPAETVGTDAVATMERMNFALGAVASVLAYFFLPRDHALGVAVGATISALNFAIIRRLVTRFIAGAVARAEGASDAPSEASSAGAMLAFFPKMLALVAAIGLSLHYLPVSALGLAAGFSIFLISGVVVASRNLYFPARPKGPNGES